LTGPPLNFDLGDYRPVDCPEILVAGCGTGQHAMIPATNYRNARVLAIDLSLSSLSYATRKTRELGFSNIEYAQADITELGTLGRQFDLIESSGVLHHLGDPMLGWRVLVDLLRAGGLMKIGLYSEAARGPVVEARALIAERGYTTSAEDIRRCREDILGMAEEQGSAMAKLVEFRDFYSLSECRDLIFHVQEHRFTLPRIEAALDTLKLKFLGFEMRDHAVLREFTKVYPHPGAAAQLPLWHEFESAHPDTFWGMYQFWCRKM
jgi:SAM-dependent methyltransferase